MIGAILGFTGLDAVFVFCGVAGGLLFVIRTIMMFVGGDSDGEGDMGGDEGFGDEGFGDEGMGDDSDASFQVLTVQGSIVFFMMFGLVGLALRKAFNQGAVVSVIGAIAAGCISVWIISRIMKSISKLQSSGTIKVKNAIGQTGTVYLTIPADGIGKAQVVVQGRLKVMDAVSDSDVEIKSGEGIEVVDIVNNRLLVKKS